MRVRVALLEMDREGLAIGGRPWERDFNLVRFLLAAISRNFAFSTQILVENWAKLKFSMVENREELE